MILVRIGGETAVSVYGILMYAEGFIQPLLYGMCDSLQPAVGYNWGAQPVFQRVRAIETCCYAASGGGFAGCSDGRPCFRANYGPVCGRRCARSMAMATGALRLFSLTYATRWFSFATQSYMLAIEKPLAASAISVSFALVLFPLC